MKVFVLDDDPARHAGFKFVFRNDDLTITNNYSEAIGQLSNAREFDIIYLDHDLNDFATNTFPGEYKDWELTGYDLVKWLVAQDPKNYPRKVVIHSWNPAGAKNMSTLLTEAGISNSREMYSVPHGLLHCPEHGPVRFFRYDTKAFICGFCEGVPCLDCGEGKIYDEGFWICDKCKD